jgi:hypothetical protein
MHAYKMYAYKVYIYEVYTRGFDFRNFFYLSSISCSYIIILGSIRWYIIGFRIVPARIANKLYPLQR